MKTVKDIEAWLDKNSISNYMITDDFQVIVHGSVNLNGTLQEKRLPINFKLVDGYFDISNNDLTSLDGCPEQVTKDFNCSFNKLESLFGGPQKVGDFNCSNNLLKNLSYCPKEINGLFDCSNNELTSIKGSPRTIRGYFSCANNKINMLKGGPKHIDSYFDCSYNYIEELFGGPVSVAEDYVCFSNQLKDLNGIADEIGSDIITDIRLNHVSNSSYDEAAKTWRYTGTEVIAHIYKPVVALNNKDDIKRWLQQHGVDNTTILSDNSVDVKGDVRLSDKLANLSKLPLSFNNVEGTFDISDNELSSLEGCPNKVGGDFLAFKNELSSLKGGPKEVGGSFIVLKNNIKSLVNAPTLVKDDFICSHNPLKDLEGLNTVQGSVFTGVFLTSVKCQKYVYHNVPTYKYPGPAVKTYLDKSYVSLTEEEKIYEQTKDNLRKAMTKMLNDHTLKKEMITDVLIKNLEKYHLSDIKEKVMLIKNPPQNKEKRALSESEVLKLAFDTEL